MKFSDIMESELNKNFPGDSKENILSYIGNNQTIKGQIKELKKLYYNGIKKDSVENKYRKKFNVNPDAPLSSWKDGNWDRYFKSLNNNEKVGVLKNELELCDKRIQEKEKEILKIKEDKEQKKKLLYDLKKSPETKQLKLQELEKIILMKNIPKVAQTIYENLKSEEFNKKLKSIISTTLDMNLLEIKLDYKFIHSNIEKWVEDWKRGRNGWREKFYKLDKYQKTDISYKDIELTLNCYPNLNKKELIKAFNLTSEKTILSKIKNLGLSEEKIQNFLKNFFPIENLLGEFKQYFDIEKDWSNNSIYSLDIGNARLDSETTVKTLQIKININIENILRKIK